MWRVSGMAQVQGVDVWKLPRAVILSYGPLTSGTLQFCLRLVLALRIKSVNNVVPVLQSPGMGFLGVTSACEDETSLLLS